MAARSGILGLGSRLYPGNMQRIFNKDLNRFMQSLSRERQNRASKRKALLAGWHFGATFAKINNAINYFVFRHEFCFNLEIWGKIVMWLDSNHSLNH